MDRLDMKSKNIVSSNIDKNKQLFPNVITEYNGKDVVDFELLKQELSEVIIDEKKEKYQLTWPGKKDAIITANTPTTNTLRPLMDKSKNFLNTENIYIEGDNLEALKILQESYLSKVKCIYIDPPYNTGTDLIYNDKFSRDSKEELVAAGILDEEGYKMTSNNKTNGRFHSDWLSMIYPRIKLARNLLKDDGVIFISIDDNELSNLIKICDEIFGENNFVGCISRATGTTTGQDANKIGSSLDYCLIYSKSDKFTLTGISLSLEDEKRFNNEDEKGKYSILQLRKTGNADRREDRPNMFYPIIAPNGEEVYPFGPTNYLSRWRVARSTFDELLKDDMIEWKRNDSEENIVIDGIKKSQWTPYVKYYLEGRTKQVSNLFTDIEGNKKASIVLKDLFGSKGIFDNPKPVEFIDILLQISTNPDDIVMDFFSGSATTAHAIMKHNKEYNKFLKFILVQLSEECENTTEAYKNGFRTICDIGEERIRRAGREIDEQTSGSVDTGFRVFKVDTSNMKDVYYKPDQIEQSNLFDYITNIKDDRNSEDLLTQVILDLGLKLDLKIEQKNILGNNIHFVEENSLIACFDEKIDINIIDRICELKPLRIVFKDTSFKNDKDKINLEERVKKLSPDTDISII